MTEVSTNNYNKYESIKENIANSIRIEEEIKKKQKSSNPIDRIAAYFLQMKRSHHQKKENKQFTEMLKKHEEIKRKLSGFDFYGYKPWEPSRTAKIPQFNKAKYKPSEIAPGYHPLNPNNRLMTNTMNQSKGMERN